VLFLGDSIVGPGMYSYVVNELVTRACGDVGVTFHSWGKAMATSESIVPDVAGALGGREFDWILLNFGHNDVGRYSAEEFRTRHGPALIEEVRRHHKGRIGWMSVLGVEPSPYGDEAGLGKLAAQTNEARDRQMPFVEAIRELCREKGLVYLPLREAIDRVLASRARQGQRVCFTMDGVHPNLFGSWMIGGLLVQCLGLTPPPMTVDVLQADTFCDHGRRDDVRIRQPVEVSFDGLFLTARLVPPPERTVEALAAARPVVVDGDPSEWGEAAVARIAPPLNVTWELVPRSSAMGYRAAMRACHDGAKLYLLFDVAEPDTTRGAWFQEIIEVLIDARKDRRSAGNVWRQTPGLTQFVFSRDFTGNVAGNATAAANGDASQGEGITAAARLKEGGYTLEAAIPLANFHQVSLTGDGPVPFDWAVSYRDQAFNLDWQGLMSRSSSTFGYGRLVLK